MSFRSFKISSMCQLCTVAVFLLVTFNRRVLGILCIDCKYLEIDGVSVLGPLGDVRCNGSHTTVNTTAECSEGCVQMGFSFRHINKQESHTVAYSLRFCAAKRPEGDGCRYMTGDHARKGSTDLRMIGFERFFSYFRTGKFEDFEGVECYCSDEDRCNAEVKNVNPLPTAIVKLYLPWVIIAPVITLTLVILTATGLRVLCLKRPNNLYVLKWNHFTEAAEAKGNVVCYVILQQFASLPKKKLQ
ncbi:uncharacterized protein LOC106179592 [Lingula anatina]|uniref:Uncharacterized protein LOC106179592 n=1 Tax=Lingula anatina TaxID=7574 RepID=A0A1S3K8J1_LINAN|nr:uncharacterized protein LOC106179592 [Lingula anatina]|eukprot:XP_013418759.1 uncharacterized protein LOC106179592 [Lingula anatina]